jgi:hypothetical protein
MALSHYRQRSWTRRLDLPIDCSLEGRIQGAIQLPLPAGRLTRYRRLNQKNLAVKPEQFNDKEIVYT